jgi:ATP-dependent exoDNAse (exonuclease V) alpha subunit
MSIMFLKIRSVSRGQGGSAVAKAAYIARDRLRDAGTERIHDYRTTPGLAHAEILRPAATPGGGPAWAGDRQTLWNQAESAERQRNARVAREYTVALPHELTPRVRIELARDFAQHLADRYGTAVDLAVHGPTARGDPRNHHAHILATTRELTADGLGRKAAIELSTESRHERGLPHVAAEYRALRAQWAELANERLREAGLAVRLEPRSHAALARERTEREHEAVALPPAGDHALARAPTAAAAPDARAREPREERALSIEAAQQRAVERWLEYRAGQSRDAREPDRERARDRDRGADAGLEL